jgi:hypothetical protein
MSSPKKKKLYWTRFQDNWLEKSDFKEWLVKRDEFTAGCRYCNINLTVKYNGIAALNDHNETKSHKTKTCSAKMSQSINAFVSTINKQQTDWVTVSELCLTYHTINHYLSYNSMDCNVKLIKNLFKDSKIAQTLQCGRTKMEALNENVLCPLSIEIHLNAIKDKKFSIASDASNKGNVKLYPIAIQYFDINKGINNFVLNFYEDSNEKSDNICLKLKQCLSENNINESNLIAYTGDNASINYGIHHSVYQMFKSANSCVVKANCNCHVLHNTAKHALITLPFDIENLVLKMFSHFSISAKRVSDLKSCYNYTDNEFQKMKKHSTTRWLTLLPAINCIINNMNELKSYFVGIGTEECPPIINEFVWSEAQNNVNISELYLHFSSHFMDLFHKNIKILEMKSTNATNLYDLMLKLKTQLENRLNKEFFGSKVNECIEKCSFEVKNTFIKSAKIVYKRAIDYLNNHFDFNDSIFKLFSHMNLDSELQFEKIVVICDKLNITLDKDTLFDELNTFNAMLNEINKTDLSCDSVSKYCKILPAFDSKNLTKVVETVLAIPVGNEFVERVFSGLKKVWTDERNRMNINLIKAEICVKNNFSLSCHDFIDFIKDNKSCITAAKSQQKYRFSKK